MENISDKVKSTPAARRIAREYKIDLDAAFSSKIDKRIDIDDVEEYARINMLKKISPQSEEKDREEPLSFFALSASAETSLREPIFDLAEPVVEKIAEIPSDTLCRIVLPPDTIDSLLYSFSHVHAKSSVIVKAFSQALSKHSSTVVTSSIRILEFSPNQGFSSFYVSGAERFSLTQLCEKITKEETITNITFYNLLCANVDDFTEDMGKDSMALYAFMNDSSIIIKLRSKADFLSGAAVINLCSSFKEYMLNPSLMLL